MPLDWDSTLTVQGGAHNKWGLPRRNSVSSWLRVRPIHPTADPARRQSSIQKVCLGQCCLEVFDGFPQSYRSITVQQSTRHYATQGYCDRHLLPRPHKCLPKCSYCTIIFLHSHRLCWGICPSAKPVHWRLSQTFWSSACNQVGTVTPPPPFT